MTLYPMPRITKGLTFMVAAAALCPAAAAAQGNGRSNPAPSMVGPVAPLATAVAAPGGSAFYAVQAAHYIAEQALQDLPPSLLHGSPDLNAAFALGDEPGPIALLAPASNLSPELLAAAPASDTATGVPAAWLALRYATIFGPDGQVPDNRLAHLVLPGPFRMTFIPLTVSRGGAGLVLNLIGKDGAVLLSTPLTPSPSPEHASVALGPIQAAPSHRTVQLILSGYTTSLQVGQPPSSELMPRPLEGNLHVGDTAPDFALKPAKEGGLIRLSDSRGRQPTVLVFGSFT